jgi:hypothetical protein
LKQYLLISTLLAVFLVLATLYSAAIPLGEGPDEPGHVAYVFFLARMGRLPVQRLDARQGDVPGEGHQPPLAYALAAPLALWLPRDERRIDTIGNPRFVWSGGAEPNAISHGSREYPPWQLDVLAWHLMRLVSAVFGAATVFFTYMAARAVDCRLQIADCRLQPSETQSAIYNSQSAIPLLAAGLVAFNPQFLFVSALVTNDALLTAISAALLWLVVTTDNQEPGIGEQRTKNREQKSEPTTDNGRRIRDAVALGIVLGLALLTKQSAIVLAPAAALALVAWRGDAHARVATGETTGRGEAAWRARLVHPFTRSPVHLSSLLNAALVIVMAALVAGWWYARNQRLYGDLLGLAAFRGEFVTQPFQIGSLAAWATALGQLHTSFWARFGWMNVAPPAWTLWLIGTIELLAVVGLVRAVVWAWQADRSSVVGHWSLIALPVLALAWIVSFAVTAGLVAWQGRLLFPALPVIAILMARGLTVWENKEQSLPLSAAKGTKNKVPRRLFLFFVLCSLFFVAIWMPENVIRPAYPPQTLPEPVALARAGNTVLFRFRRRGERSITLRGWRLDGPAASRPMEARPGATLDLTLTWYASARQVRDWVVFVHLVDGQGRVVAEDNRQPRDGAFPTTQWNMGDWIEDQHRLRLPDSLAGGTYTLRIGLYDSTQNNQRAEVRIDEARPLGDALDLGSIIVTGGG